MKTLISILVVSGEAEMNNGEPNSHGEPKSVHLVLSQISMYKITIIGK